MFLKSFTLNRFYIQQTFVQITAKPIKKSNEFWNDFVNVSMIN